MKKIFIYIALFFPLLSCNDWLTVESENDITQTSFFKTENDAQSWIYTLFAEQQSQAIMNPTMLDYCGLICSDAGSKEGYRRLDPTFCLDSRGTNMSSWKGQYNLIYLADMLIDNSNRLKIADERKEFWLAQAYFAKAYAYFDLARRWGEAPITQGSESTASEPKQPVEKVLAEALRYAEMASVLPKYTELRDANGNLITSKQFVSIATVHTLLANIYAWMGGLYGEKEYWEKAEGYLNKVIGGEDGLYALEPDIDLMLQNCQGDARNSLETIYNIELNEQDIDYNYNSDLYYFYPGLVLVNYPYTTLDPEKINIETQSARITVDKVKEVFKESTDRRLKRYWYRLGEVKYHNPASKDPLDSLASQYAFINKWNEARYQNNPEVVNYYSGVIEMKGNKVIWRLADLILLRAECRARLGNTAGAKDDLDRIRKRAGLQPYAGSTSAEDLRKEIFRERERELFGEGHRYFDIVRNGYYREELEGNYKTLTDEDVKNGALYMPVYIKTNDKNVLLKQNTYWLWQK